MSGLDHHRLFQSILIPFTIQEVLMLSLKHLCTDKRHFTHWQRGEHGEGLSVSLVGNPRYSSCRENTSTTSGLPYLQERGEHAEGLSASLETQGSAVALAVESTPRPPVGWGSTPSPSGNETARGSVKIRYR